MVSKSRKKSTRKRRGAGRKRRNMRGAGWFDYVPSLSSVPGYSYIPAKESIPGYKYIPAKESIPGYNFAKGVKAGYDVVSNVGAVFNQPANISVPPPIPPLPPGGHPRSRYVEEHNRKVMESIPSPFMESKAMLDAMNRNGTPRLNTGETKQESFLERARKYKPVTFIDNALQQFGVRDKVREKLGQSTLGRALVQGADFAKTIGLGRPRRRRVTRKAYGGSKTRRRTHRRGTGAIIV